VNGNILRRGGIQFLPHRGQRGGRQSEKAQDRGGKGQVPICKEEGPPERMRGKVRLRKEKTI